MLVKIYFIVGFIVIYSYKYILFCKIMLFKLLNYVYLIVLLYVILFMFFFIF